MNWSKFFCIEIINCKKQESGGYTYLKDFDKLTGEYKVTDDINDCLEFNLKKDAEDIYKYKDFFTTGIDIKIVECYREVNTYN